MTEKSHVEKCEELAEAYKKFEQNQPKGIAEFVGVERYDGYFNLNDKTLKVQYPGSDLAFIYVRSQAELSGWLASDAGTVAMIYHIINKHPIEFFSNIENNYVTAEIPIANVMTGEPTLNAALQAAILEVMKNE